MEKRINLNRFNEPKKYTKSKLVPKYKSRLKEFGFTCLEYVKEKDTFYFRRDIDSERWIKLGITLCKDSSGISIGIGGRPGVLRAAVYNKEIVDFIEPIMNSNMSHYPFDYGLQFDTYYDTKLSEIDVRNEEDFEGSIDTIGKHIKAIIEPITEYFNDLQKVYHHIERSFINWTEHADLTFKTAMPLYRLFLRAKLHTNDFYQFSEKIDEFISRLREGNVNLKFADNLENWKRHSMPLFEKAYNSTDLSVENIEEYQSTPACRTIEDFEIRRNNASADYMEQVQIARERAERKKIFWSEYEKGNNPKVEWDIYDLNS